ncbi:MAG: esterase/lipase family protein [Gemmatimonadaceae bacterium]
MTLEGHAGAVVLLHGLGRTRRSMEPIARAARRRGYLAFNHGYPSRRMGVDALAEEIRRALWPALAALPGPVHFVTHSLGGLLVRAALAAEPLPTLGRVVMLCPPNVGSEVADRLRGGRFYRWLTGPAGQELGTDPAGAAARLGPPAFEVGVIAGSRSVEPHLSRFIPGPNDGKVAVERARLEGMRDFLVVERSHPFVMRAPEVVDAVFRFLEQGEF